MSSILVGLDLSPSSRAALPWAAEQARLTGQRLLAVNGGSTAGLYQPTSTLSASLPCPSRP
jgi:hypothetical protein